MRHRLFNDVDLNPDEVDVDFSRNALPSQPTLGTIGLWCGLHGESFLQAGMHHLECRFDHALLRDQLKAEDLLRTSELILAIEPWSRPYGPLTVAVAPPEAEVVPS